MAAKQLKLWVGWILALVAVSIILATGQSSKQKYPDRIPVRFWHRWQADWEVQVNKIVDAFNESQDKYEVIPLSTPSGGSDAKFIMGVIGGDPPDVMSIWNGAIPNLAANNFLSDLEMLMTPEERKTYFEDAFPNVRQSGMYKGKVYGVTIGSDVYGLYVNAKLFREAGLDPDKDFPKTYEDLVELGMKLTKFDKNGNITHLGFQAHSLDFTSRSFGGGFFVKEDGSLVINTPQNLKALKMIVEMRKRLGYERVNRFQAGLNTGAGTATWPFMDGDLTITFDGMWRVEELRKFRPDMDYRVYPVPPPREGGTPLGGNVSGNFMIIPSSAKQKEGAWEFVKFWSGLENPNRAAKFYNMGGWLPLTPEVVNSPNYQAWLNDNKQYQTFIDILSSPNCTPMSAVPYLQFLNDQVGRAEDQAVRGQKTPEQALIDLEADIKKEIAKRKALGYED